MANQKIPSYLNAEQRQALMEIPSDLSERDLARYYSFTQEELKLINSRRRPENRFGFAVQLALLRFPGRPLAEYHGDFRQVPPSILQPISHQLGLPVSIYREYGQRISTLIRAYRGYLQRMRVSKMWMEGISECSSPPAASRDGE